MRERINVLSDQDFKEKRKELSRKESEKKLKSLNKFVKTKQM